MNNLDNQQFFRGHINLSCIGKNKQKTLENFKVLMVGAGGLGCQLGLLLGNSGLQLTIIDADTIELSNLLRQLAYTHKDIGKSKAETLKQAIIARNPQANITAINKSADKEFLQNALQTIKYDLVLDATDNRNTKLAINSACLAEKQPWISANSIQTDGNVIFFDRKKTNTACYNCLYPQPQKELNCSDRGVLNSLVTLIASLQASMAINLAINPDKLKTGELISFDAANMQFMQIKIPKNPLCSVCSKG